MPRRAKIPAARARALGAAVAEPEPVAGSVPLPNVRHERFAQRLVATQGNRPLAVREAGYTAATDKSAHRQALMLLRRQEVALRIAWLQGKASRLAELEAGAVLKEIMLLAASDINDYTFDPRTGKITTVEGADPAATRAVRSYKRTVLETRKNGSRVLQEEIALWDKPSQLAKLGDHLRLWLTGGGVGGTGGGGNQFNIYVVGPEAVQELVARQRADSEPAQIPGKVSIGVLGPAEEASGTDGA